MRRRQWITTAVAAAAGAALTLPMVPPANAGRIAPAGGADTIITSGSCAKSGFWTMGARAKNRGIGVKVRIKGGRPGQVWRTVLTHKGRVVTQGPRRVGPRRAAFIKARTVNLPGVDTYSFAARNPTTGGTCTGSLAY